MLAERMTKASSPCQRQGEWKGSRGQELAGMQFPRSCKEKRGETGGWWEGLRRYCTARILTPHHHPKSGLRCASPF